MRRSAALVAIALACLPASARADQEPEATRHRIALGLGAGQLSTGLVLRLYLVDPVFVQVSAASLQDARERQTTGVLSAGARVHATDRTSLLVRGGVACHVNEDRNPTDNHIAEVDGCLHFLAGFGAEVLLFWKVATMFGVTLGWSPDVPRWLLLPELEFTVHLG